MQRRRMKRMVVGLAGAITAGGALLGIGMTSSAGASTPPAIPNLSKPTSVILSGHNGKPIIGKNGQPIRITVGGRVPMPPAPGSPAFNAAQAGVKPLTSAQLNKMPNVQPEQIQVPVETDQQKAQRLAPNQAVTPSSP